MPRPLLRSASLALALVLAACASPRPPAPSKSAPIAAASHDAIELVESAPAETTLNHADVRDAADVWPEMIAGARATLDIAQFYVSDAPGSRMNAVIAAIEAAADRGVHVRLLVEKVFRDKYPESVERLGKRANVEVRVFDLHATMGGILHAKYFVVDGHAAFVGSQNFDWRALEHIQEIGVRLESVTLAGQLDALFAADWDVAGGAPATRWAKAWTGGEAIVTGDGLKVRLGASPRGYLPDEAMWDLPMLVDWIDRARATIDVQLLTYKPVMRNGAEFATLDDALRRAAARGVCVRLLVSHWGMRDAGLAKLARELPAPSSVRVLTIPPASSGEIPFARVSHAKYAVFDGARAWVGTSNWEGDYFLASRNVSVLVEGAPFAARLDGIFVDGWGSAYAKPLLPGP
jgi:phosphatidylserine/phosphatidylglycerophosphate/cardiolipin synthase-like enzyme